MKGKVGSSYKLILAVGLGWLSFGLVFFTSRLQFREVYINFPWSIILPLLLTLVWGTRYGLISISFGAVAFYPFFLGSYNGFASLVPVLTFFLWIILHGEGARLRREYRGPLPSWVFSVYVVQLVHALLRLILYLTLFPLLLRLNGSYWDSRYTGIYPF